MTRRSAHPKAGGGNPDVEHWLGGYLRQFLTTFNVPFTADAMECVDSFWDFAAESPRFHDALDEITDEVFHVLFNDVGFLHQFNDLCSRYIETAGFGEELKTRKPGGFGRTLSEWLRV